MPIYNRILCDQCGRRQNYRFAPDLTFDASFWECSNCGARVGIEIMRSRMQVEGPVGVEDSGMSDPFASLSQALDIKRDGNLLPEDIFEPLPDDAAPSRKAAQPMFSATGKGKPGSAGPVGNGPGRASARSAEDAEVLSLFFNLDNG